MNVLHVAGTTANGPTANRRIDVTDMQAEALAEYVQSELGEATVRLERRANRTYLVADGVS